MARLFSAADASELEKELRTDAAAAPQDIKDIFCKGWPAARTVIEAALKMVKNPIVKLILTVVEEIGDALQKAICPQ